MTIECLAIVGKNNEPLYLSDFNFGNKAAEDELLDDREDVFGFSEEASKELENNLSLDNEFILHASLDHLEEALGIHLGLPSRRQAGSHWIGFLWKLGHLKCYGYATATNVKFLVMAKDNVSEPKLKKLFGSVHDLYVKNTMNPFSKIGGKIVSSKRFGRGVKDAVLECVKGTSSS